MGSSFKDINGSVIINESNVSKEISNACVSVEQNVSGDNSSNLDIINAGSGNSMTELDYLLQRLHDLVLKSDSKEAERLFYQFKECLCDQNKSKSDAQSIMTKLALRLPQIKDTTEIIERLLKLFL